MKELTINDVVAVCDRIVAALQEKGYSTGYAEDLGIGLGEYLYYKSEDYVMFQFCSASTHAKHFEINMDTDVLGEDVSCVIGEVGHTLWSVTIEEFEKELMKEIKN